MYRSQKDILYSINIHILWSELSRISLSEMRDNSDDRICFFHEYRLQMKES